MGDRLPRPDRPLLTAALPAKEEAAHPLEEYVQSTYVDPAPDRTNPEIQLTPGVLVAPEVVALIDADGDCGRA